MTVNFKFFPERPYISKDLIASKISLFKSIISNPRTQFFYTFERSELITSTQLTFEKFKDSCRIKDLVKNPETITKTKRVESIKQEIRDKKSEIGEIRKILGKLEGILKQIKTRREKIEERINISP